MKSHEIAKQLLTTRKKLYDTKISGDTVDIDVFSQFQIYLTQLKQLLKTEKQGYKRDQAIVHILQCFSDDHNLGSNGYSSLNATFCDNKSTGGDSLLESLAHYEQANPTKILQRDYNNYMQNPIQENGLIIFEYQINYVIDAIFKQQSFDVRHVLQIGNILHSYLCTPSDEHNTNVIIRKIASDTNISQLPSAQQEIIKYKLHAFFNNPSQTKIIEVLQSIIQPSRIDLGKYHIHRHKRTITSTALIGLLALGGYKIHKRLNDPFLGDTSHKVTYYSDRQQAITSIRKYNAELDTLLGGTYKDNIINISNEEIDKIIGLEDIKQNWKKNTQLFFDKLPKYNNTAVYIGKDNKTYVFTQEDVNDALALINCYDMTKLSKCFRSACSSLATTTNPEHLMASIVTNISFFPLGQEAAGVHIHSTKDNSIILINTSFIAPEHTIDYNALDRVLLHELLHGIFGDRPFVIAREGKTDRYTDYYLYKYLHQDHFNANDLYAPFKIADGLWGANMYTQYVDLIAGPGIASAFANEAQHIDFLYPNDKAIQAALDDLCKQYHTEKSSELFRAIKATKVYQLIKKYPEHSIDPKLFLAMLDDDAGVEGFHANLAGLDTLVNNQLNNTSKSQNANIYKFTPEGFAYVDQLIQQYKQSVDYEHFHNIKTPEQRIKYFDTVKHKYIGPMFHINVNIPKKAQYGSKYTNKERGNGGLYDLQKIIPFAFFLVIGWILANMSHNNTLIKSTLIKKLKEKVNIHTENDMQITNLNKDTISWSIFAINVLTWIYCFILAIQKDSNMTDMAKIISIYALCYILTITRKQYLLSKEKYITLLQETIASQHKSPQTEQLADLLKKNQVTINEYKKRFYNIMSEPNVRTFITNKTQGQYADESYKQQKHITIANYMSTKRSDYIMRKIRQAFGLESKKTEMQCATSEEFKIINKGEPIQGRINRRKTAQQTSDKIVIAPYEYKTVKSQKNSKDSIFVCMCLDTPCDKPLIDQIQNEHNEQKKYLKSPTNGIQQKIVQRQYYTIEHIAEYIMGLYTIKNQLYERITLGLTLDGKMVQVVPFNRLSLANIRILLEDIYDLHFQNYTLWTYQGFDDNHFLEKYFYTIPEKIITMRYAEGALECAYHIKKMKDERGMPSTIHTIDNTHRVTKNYQLPSKQHDQS